MEIHIARFLDVADFFGSGTVSTFRRVVRHTALSGVRVVVRHASPLGCVANPSCIIVFRRSHFFEGTTISENAIRFDAADHMHNRSCKLWLHD